MKYLYVEMIDNWSAFSANQLNLKGFVTSRIVKVPLTEEQLTLITPKKIGSNAGSLMYEEIRLVSIQEE